MRGLVVLVTILILASPAHAAYDYNTTIGQGISGNGTGQFNSPTAVVVDENGTVFVADSYNHRIQVFDSNFSYVKTIGSHGNATGQFEYPTGLALDSSGLLYVADKFNHRVQVFDADGDYVAQIGGDEGSASGQFSRPTGVSIAPNGDVYVADSNNHRVQVFNSSLSYKATIGGTYGEGNGQFKYPSAVHVSDKVYVTDEFNHRVQAFHVNGSFYKVLGGQGETEGKFYRPAGVLTGPSGRLYAADTENCRLQVFNSSLAYLASIGAGCGSANSQFLAPMRPSFGPDGRLYIADKGNHRVQVFLTDERGECVTSADCDDANACTIDACSGFPKACTSTLITACSSGDACCPSGCNLTTDADCTGCGDGSCNQDETIYTCGPSQNKTDCAVTCDFQYDCSILNETWDCGTSSFAPLGVGSCYVAACGDGHCNGPETKESCCEDCGPLEGQACHDGINYPLTNATCSTHSDCNATQSCKEEWCDTGAGLCFFPPVGNCIDLDGCCPAGCNITTDADCVECGDGVCSSGEGYETCCADCGCPALQTCALGSCHALTSKACLSDSTCDDSDACTLDFCYMEAYRCANIVSIEDCGGGDSCCPEGCNATTDSDCIPGECSVDSDCDDDNACTREACSGDPKTCSYTSITACGSPDACCPPGCTFLNDPDCRLVETCGDGYCIGTETNETCCSDCCTAEGYGCVNSSCQLILEDQCSSDEDCADDSACTIDSCEGSPKVCRHRPVEACSSGDACCPAGCDYTNDDDCEKPAACGDGVCEAGEDSSTCCTDCPCYGGYECIDNTCVSTTENVLRGRLSDSAELQEKLGEYKEKGYAVEGPVLAEEKDGVYRYAYAVTKGGEVLTLTGLVDEAGVISMEVEGEAGWLPHAAAVAMLLAVGSLVYLLVLRKKPELPAELIPEPEVKPVEKMAAESLKPAEEARPAIPVAEEALHHYAQSLLRQGYTRAQARQKLASEGYTQEQIDWALR